MQTNTYLYFSGQCEEAFTFYEKCLGGKILMMLPHSGTPAEAQTPVEWRNKILHARMELDGGTLLMASDAPPGHQSKPSGFSVNLTVQDAATAERVFAELSAGGSLHMPLQKTFFAERFAMFTDRFGTPWMINCEPVAS